MTDYPVSNTLSPGLKSWLDEVIIPALVDEYLSQNFAVVVEPDSVAKFLPKMPLAGRKK